MPQTCKLDTYMTLCEGRDILDLDELDVYVDACGCEDCASMPPVMVPDDPDLTTIRLAG